MLVERQVGHQLLEAPVLVLQLAQPPQLGDAEAGAVAALTSPRVSVVSGGLACIAGVLFLVRLVPELARYDAEAETRRSDG